MEKRMRINRISLRRTLILGTAAGLGLLVGGIAPALAQPPSHAPAWGYRRNDDNRDRERIRRERERQRELAQRERERAQRERERERERARRERERERDRRRDNRSDWNDRNDYDWREGRWNYGSGYRWRNSGLPDMDRDGIPDRHDNDIDGDGVANTRDRNRWDPRVR
jgi:hypothetical protein